MTATDTHPGSEADTPAAIPPRGWWQVVRRAFAESSADNISILAGGVAFFAFLALFPALIAALTLYGLVADPATVARQVEDLAAGLPQDTQPLVAGMLESLTTPGGSVLGVGLIMSLLLALWSASGGTASLMSAINLAYDEDETRNFLRLRGTALALTLGAIVFVLLALGLVAVVPVLFDALPLGPVGTVVAQVLRWALLVGVVVVALAVVYRVAPDRRLAATPPRANPGRWASGGRRPPTPWPHDAPGIPCPSRVRQGVCGVAWRAHSAATRAPRLSLTMTFRV